MAFDSNIEKQKVKTDLRPQWLSHIPRSKEGTILLLVRMVILIQLPLFSVHLKAQSLFSRKINRCDLALQWDTSRAPKDLLRREIFAAQQRDFNSGRANARFANFIQGRARFVETKPMAGFQVVSLGSGPDIFLPLYLYPQAKYFHLVDILAGWNTGPVETMTEIEQRLKTLAGASGSVTRLGPSEDWLLGRGHWRSPRRWKVQWLSAHLGPQEQIFILHQRDFQKSEDLADLETFWKSLNPSAPLGGVVVTGVSARLEVRRFFLDRLAAGGSMFTEMLFANKLRTLVHPEDHQILAALKKDFDVYDLGPGEVKTADLLPRRLMILPKGWKEPLPKESEILIEDLVQALAAADPKNEEDQQQIFSRELELETIYGVAVGRAVFREAFQRWRSRQKEGAGSSAVVE
jgi:hypothetical protein